MNASFPPSADAILDLLQYVSLEVKGRTYALPIEKVVEFRTWIEPAPLPNAPSFVLGIVNIRGEIVPVFDVGARLGFGPTQPSPKHVITLVHTGAEQVVGLLVDDVSDIILLPAERITSLPELDPEDSGEVMQSVIEVGDGVIGVIGIDALCEEDKASTSLARACGASPTLSLPKPASSGASS